MYKVKTFQEKGKKTHICRTDKNFGLMDSICGVLSYNEFDREERSESFSNVDCERCKKIYMKNKSEKNPNPIKNYVFKADEMIDHARIMGHKFIEIEILSDPDDLIVKAYFEKPKHDELELLKKSNTEKGKIIDELTDKIKKLSLEKKDISDRLDIQVQLRKEHGEDFREVEFELDAIKDKFAKVEKENKTLKGIVEAIKKVTEIA